MDKTIYIESLGDLPSHSKMREGGNYHWYDRSYYPWKKVDRFLNSRVGYLWDDVIAEYVKLDWVPVQYRTYSQLTDHVEVKTFMRDGKVYHFQARYGNYGNSETPIEENWRSEVYYVHPVTRKLCYYRQKPINWEAIRQKRFAKYCKILGDYHQLVKMNGIWYEVKGEIIPDNIINVDGLYYREIGSIIHPYQKFSPTYLFNGKWYVPVHHSEKRTIYSTKECLVIFEDDKNMVPKKGWQRHARYNGINIVLCKQVDGKTLKQHNLKNGYEKK